MSVPSDCEGAQKLEWFQLKNSAGSDAFCKQVLIKGRGSTHRCDRRIWAGNLRAYVGCYAYDAETPGRILCKPEKPSVEG